APLSSGHSDPSQPTSLGTTQRSVRHRCLSAESSKIGEDVMSRLSRRTTIAYSMGQLGSGLYGAFNNFTLSLYLYQFTQNAILIGWLSQTRSFEQSIIQPIVGARSDRTWTRFGRRAPFFLATMPIVALLLIVNGVL